MGFASPRIAGILAHKSPRPGVYSNDAILDSLLHRESSCKTRPLCISFPGGFVVSMRRYSCIQVTASSEYCCICSAGICDGANAARANPCSKMRTTEHTMQSQQFLFTPPNRNQLRKHVLHRNLHVEFEYSADAPTGKIAASGRFFHAVFISGFPKLPCRFVCSLSSRPVQGYNVLRYQAVSELQRRTRFGIATCNSK